VRSLDGFRRPLLVIANRRHPWLALAVASPLWLFGCATTVFPPDRVADPAQIGVLDHGHHASLLVEMPGDGMLRYSYGDWQWYALRRTGPAEASAALFWPSQAALGRKELPGPLSPMAVSRQIRVPIEHALYLTVEARAVRRLVERLDEIFYENSASRVYNEAYDLVFVPHPDPYSMTHNSNQVVGEWLEQLGCRVEGTTLFSIWKQGTDQFGSASGKSEHPSGIGMLTQTGDAYAVDEQGSSRCPAPRCH
jgi:hypothetical protein